MRDGSLSSTIQHLGLRGVITSQARARKQAGTASAQDPPESDDTPARELFGGPRPAEDIIDGLQFSLDSAMTMLTNYVSAVESAAPSVAESMEYYTVTFGPGAVGMVVALSEDGALVVSELRFSAATGQPLLAKACGKISLGDEVLAISGVSLARDTFPCLADVASAFQTMPRPLTVLFKRREIQRAETGGDDTGDHEL
jgi:hypothetical protein